MFNTLQKYRHVFAGKESDSFERNIGFINDDPFIHVLIIIVDMGNKADCRLKQKIAIETIWGFFPIDIHSFLVS